MSDCGDVPPAASPCTYRLQVTGPPPELVTVGLATEPTVGNVTDEPRDEAAVLIALANPVPVRALAALDAADC